jgi:hypothetical protein
LQRLDACSRHPAFGALNGSSQIQHFLIRQRPAPGHSAATFILRFVLRELCVQGFSRRVANSASARGCGGTAATCLSTDAGFNFNTIRSSIDFRLGFRTPTAYFNCQNPELPGPGIGGELYPRGVKSSADDRTTVQLTIRTGEPFWENYDHADAPLHFDQFAARAHGNFGSTTIELEHVDPNDNVVNENYTAFPVPWRWCSPELTGYTPPEGGTWRMRFEQGQFYDPSIPQNLSSDAGYRDYYDLVSHIQSAQGYLNGQGRCAIQRHFPFRTER